MFEPGDRVEITAHSHEQLLSAVVRQTDDKFMLLIISPAGRGVIKEGQLIRLTSSDSSGLYQIETPVVKVRDLIIAISKKSPRLIQRRRTTRYRCSITTRYIPDITIEELQQREEWEGEVSNIVDISQGGARLKVHELIEVGRRVSIAMEMEGEEPLYLETVVADTAGEQNNDSNDGCIGLRITRIPRVEQLRLQRMLSYLERQKAALERQKAS